MFGSHIVDWSMMIAIHMKLSQVTVASDDMIHWPLPNVSYHQKCRAIICTVSDHHTRWTTKPILWLRSWNLDRFKVRTQVHCQYVFFFLRCFEHICYLSTATMRVYRDLFVYKEGVYKHTAASRSEASGFHSVRLVGWGETRHGHEITKYWVSHHTHRKHISMTIYENNWKKKHWKITIYLTDRCQFMGYMVGRGWILPYFARYKRMWNRKLRVGNMATCSSQAKKATFTSPVLLNPQTVCASFILHLNTHHLNIYI